MRAKTIAMEDTGAFLTCSESGCGRPWSVQIERPHCSLHQWGRNEAGPISAAHQYAYRGNYTGDKAWAHRIIERHEAGTGVTETTLAMARRALGLIE